MYSMGFIALLVFACVLYGFYGFVDIWLCAAWVLSVCLYLIVCCMGFSVLMTFGCVCMGFIVLLIFHCGWHGF